jgi:transcriptional regulator with XRE-family HTH domain
MTAPAGDSGPTVLRMILGRQLQTLRERAGLTYEQAAEAIYASPWTVRRMERAEGGLKPLSVKGLLLAYGVTDVREVDTFLALAKQASKPGWWHAYTDILPSWFRTAIGLEESAELIRGYEPHCVPGLLQTADYARALIGAGFPDSPDEERARIVQLRMARQQVLGRPHLPRLWIVIGEAVLRCPAGDRGVMRAQLDHLIDVTASPGITLQVLPFSAGIHPAMYGPFRVFRFASPDLPDIVYGEHMTSAFYLDKPEEAAAHLQALDRISALAAPAGQTPSILRDVRKEL